MADVGCPSRTRRSAMPVRSRIHSSDVSTIFFEIAVGQDFLGEILLHRRDDRTVSLPLTFGHSTDLYFWFEIFAAAVVFRSSCRRDADAPVGRSLRMTIWLALSFFQWVPPLVAAGSRNSSLRYSSHFLSPFLRCVGFALLCYVCFNLASASHRGSFALLNALAQAFVQILPAGRAQPLAVGPTVDADRQLDDEGIPQSLSEVERPGFRGRRCASKSSSATASSSSSVASLRWRMSSTSASDGSSTRARQRQQSPRMIPAILPRKVNI